MGQVHIRDMLAISPQEHRSGKVSTKTMCGLDDPKMNTLTFGDPKAVVYRKVEHVCQKCRSRWVREAESDKNQIQQQNKFRKLLHKVNNLNRFRGQR